MNNILSQFDIRYISQIDSTNKRAKLLAASGNAVNNLVIWTDNQEGGYGREGREWKSPKGNLALSIVCKENWAIDTLWQLNFVTSLAVRETLLAFLPRQSQIELKWPNDVLVSKKKICGILPENGLKDAQVQWTVIGVGINTLNYPEDKEVLYPATSLKAQEGAILPRKPADLLHAFLESFTKKREQWVQGGFPDIREEWLNHMVHKPGDGVEIKIGNRRLSGKFDHITDDGSMALHQHYADGRLIFVKIGDLFLIERDEYAARH